MATDNADAQTTKVVVGKVNEFNEVQELDVHFTNYQELMDYYQNRQFESIAVLVDNIQQFLSQAQVSETSSSQIPSLKIALTKSQLADINLLLADLLLQQQKLKQTMMVINSIPQDTLTNSQQLKLTTLRGKWFKQNKDWFKAVGYFSQVYKASEQQNNLYSQVQSAIDLADIYFYLGDHTLSFHWQQKALELSHDENQLGLLFETATTISSMQQNMAQYELAEQTLLTALKKAKKLKLMSVQINLSKQLSDVYLESKQTDKARKELESTYLIASALRNKPQQYSLLIGLIHLELIENNVEQANKIFIQANKLTKYIEDDYLRTHFVYTNAMLLAAKGQLVKALNTLKSLTLTFENKKPLLTQSEFLLQQAKWQALLGQGRSATLKFEQYAELLKSDTEQQAKHRLSFVMQGYEQDKQQTDEQIQYQKELIDTLTQQNSQLNFELNRNVMIFIILLIGLCGYAVFYLKKQQEQRLSWMNLDLISGAKNHNYLARRYKQYVEHKVNFSLILFDIDDMTSINQQLGHDLADMLLRQMVQTLGVRLSAEKELIRVGGDKFLVIAKNFNRKQAFLLAEILRKELNNQSYDIQGRKVKISASFAATEFHSGETLESLKQELNLGVQIAKQAGGDQTAKLSS